MGQFLLCFLTEIGLLKPMAPCICVRWSRIWSAMYNCIVLAMYRFHNQRVCHLCLIQLLQRISVVNPYRLKIFWAVHYRWWEESMLERGLFIWPSIFVCTCVNSSSGAEWENKTAHGMTGALFSLSTFRIIVTLLTLSLSHRQYLHTYNKVIQIDACS